MQLHEEAGAVRREVGMLGHATGLYDDLTVEENVRFWARACRSEGKASADSCFARSSSFVLVSLSLRQRRALLISWQSPRAGP